jgi:multidrug efflux system outer membrane protein
MIAHNLYRFAAMPFLMMTTAMAGLPSVGPEHKAPEPAAPAAFKNSTSGKQQGIPAQWWKIFQDPALNALVESVSLDSKNLKAVEARVRQAKAQVDASRAGFFPLLDGGFSGQKNQGSKALDFVFPITETETYRTGIELGYEIDLWGKVRRGVEASRAEFDAGGAALEGLRLSLQSQVAGMYFMVRSVDAERAILTKTVASRSEALSLTKSKLDAGTGNELDVERARTELATSQAELASLHQQRSKFENAIAVLTGKNASEFSVPAGGALAMPAVPSGVPSELLKRRPDIHQAERLLAAANARIGVAKSAYFPSLRLSASAGWEGNEIKRLGESASEVNGIGFSFSIPLFDGGRRKASLDASKAAHDEAKQTFENTVLIAFQEVEDALSAVSSLAKQRASLGEAVESARKAVKLSRSRYDGGLVSYFEVIEADRTALNLELSAERLRGMHFSAVATLIKALGGGWDRPAAK